LQDFDSVTPPSGLLCFVAITRPTEIDVAVFHSSSKTSRQISRQSDYLAAYNYDQHSSATSNSKRFRLKNRKYLTLSDAKIIAAACENEALRQSWAVTIAIADDGGHLLWLQRLDGAPLISMNVAIGKAHTSAMGRRPTKSFTDRIAGGETSVLSMPGGLTFLEGGEPILVDGICVGAVGVSGVKSAEDAQIARAGISSFLQSLNQ
jgi:glc operon protein GlcG